MIPRRRREILYKTHKFSARIRREGYRMASKVKPSRRSVHIRRYIAVTLSLDRCQVAAAACFWLSKINANGTTEKPSDVKTVRRKTRRTVTVIKSAPSDNTGICILVRIRAKKRR